jgi:Xaa-Pro aminopeptidase
MKMEHKLSAKELFLQKITPGDEVLFSEDEYRDRLNRIRSRMAREKIDVLYLSSPESIFYVNGYKAEWYQSQSPKAWLPSSGIAIEAEHDQFIFFEHEAEAAIIKRACVSNDTRFFPSRSRLLDWIVEELRKESWLPGTVGLEMWSYRPNRAVSEMFQKELEKVGCKVVDGTDIVRDLRAIKSQQEIAHIEKAAEIADIGMNAAIESMKPGMTELEVYGQVVHAMANAGGENASLPVLVRTDGAGHSLASTRKIRKGEIVEIDLCGVFNRYHSNMCRTFSMGKPHPEVERVFGISVGAFDMLREFIRPNLPVAEFNERISTYYKEAGFKEYLRWSGGYELGIGFPPDWVGWFVYDPNYDPGDRLFVPGTVVNHECLSFLPLGFGGAGIINTLVFYKDQAKILGQTPDDLIII